MRLGALLLLAAGCIGPRDERTVVATDAGAAAARASDAGLAGGGPSPAGSDAGVTDAGARPIEVSPAAPPADARLAPDRPPAPAAPSCPPGGCSLPPATRLAAGALHTCAITTGGLVHCWGSNTAGQLGIGATSDSGGPLPVSGIEGATSVAAGSAHTCAVVAGGAVKCWGGNGAGQLGDGTTDDSPVPVAVKGVTTATAVAASYVYTCALLASGGVSCWGQALSAPLVRGPVPIGQATAVTAGVAHACAALADGTVACWGDNERYQLGDGTLTSSAVPVKAIGVGGAGPLIAASARETCVALKGGGVSCWGARYGDVVVPAFVGETALALGAGDLHVCAVISDGTVRCLGTNAYGQLGDGTRSDAYAPVVAAGVSGATAVAGGAQHTCALVARGTVRCWGANGSGQLGDGTRVDSPTAVTVPGS